MELDKKPLQLKSLKIINKEYNRFLKTYPNTSKELGINIQQLASIIGITKQGLHGALNSLYAKGFLKSNRKKEHSSFFLIPTEKGKRIKL